MKVEKVHNGIRYTLSNEGLTKGDLVYPIANGRCLDNHGWILHGFDFRDYMSGFPDEPHTIITLGHSEYKPYEIRTDMGYGPIETYYKIIKKEKQVKDNSKPFSIAQWVEIVDKKFYNVVKIGLYLYVIDKSQRPTDRTVCVAYHKGTKEPMLDEHYYEEDEAYYVYPCDKIIQTTNPNIGYPIFDIKAAEEFQLTLKMALLEPEQIKIEL